MQYFYITLSLFYFISFVVFYFLVCIKNGKNLLKTIKINKLYNSCKFSVKKKTKQNKKKKHWCIIL